MATAMSSTFTAADRRKRVATYGKSSRMAPSFNWGDDAPSPERPRKQTALGGGTTLKRPANGTLGGARTQGSTRSVVQRSPATRDVFDVPSDEELLSPAPIKKTVTKQTPIADIFDFPPSNDEAAVPQRKRSKTPQPLRKPEPARRAFAAPKGLPKPDQPPATPLNELDKPLRPLAKTPQVLQKVDVEQRQIHVAKKPAARPPSRSRRTTPAPLAAGTQKKGKTTSTTSSKKAIAKPPELDVFDVPLSEDEAPMRTPRKPPPATTSRKAPTHNRIPSSGAHIESDGSSSDRKRKREMATESTSNRARGTERKRDVSVQSRDKKYQKQVNVKEPQRPSQPVSTGRLAPTINKPKRTRVRTTNTLPKPLITKTQSSPANLHGMLAVRSVPTQASVAELPEATGVEDEETMYDIQEIKTPLARLAKTSMHGPVSPTQRQLLSSLVEDNLDVTTPSMPSIRRLQLTEQKPRSILNSLTRSTSDVPHPASSRKPRLIDTLKQAAPSLDYDEEDSDSSEESEGDSPRALTTTKPPKYNSRGDLSLDSSVYDDMDVEIEVNGRSQASQTSINAGNASKVTYAKQRSFREEANPEDDLLLAMDLDDPLGFGGFGSNKATAPVSEDEEEEASQVRGIHELRRKGQNQKFLNEVESAIDDIAGLNGLGNSMRRSAMLELCTRMTDQTFVEQLLDSGLGARFLASVGSQGEIIFDFAASAALCFIMSNGLGSTVIDDIYHSGIMDSLISLLEKDADIDRIAKDRKTNMSKVGRESVSEFRALVQQSSSIWSSEKPERVSPQIVALKALEMLVLGLRKAGSTEAIVIEGVIFKLLDIAAGPNNRLKIGKATAQDLMTSQLAFSIMEAVSMSKQKQATWSNRVLRRLVELMPAMFDASSASPIKLAVRLCMNLTNNKPKACEAFAGPAFVQPLVGSISHKFHILAGEVEDEEREEVLEGLILCLGAMINLAEFSDQARTSVVADGDELVDALAKTFLEGSERAAQADSLEASHASVTVGYLTVLLGNLCLNDLVRYKVRSHLPGQRLDMLVEQIKEFVRYNERVDRETNHFEGDEGRETWRNFTMRLLLVVERLEKAES